MRKKSYVISLYTSRMRGPRLKFPQDRSCEFRKGAKLCSRVNSKTEQSGREKPTVAELREVKLNEELAKSLPNRMKANGNN